ncbi:right-handed parallel beta-helix repeat-containing protein [Paenibacillus sp. y28]|uniref:right-handed parallel beta-helix repeat-containing protein n=1 Tax=Paenibacillus sp. y28 TaxID=3129110 RepID=UPI003FA756C3
MKSNGQGVVITNSGTSCSVITNLNINVNHSPASAITSNGSYNTVISKCIIVNSLGRAISFRASHLCLVHENTIYGCNTGIEGFISTLTIKNNTIHSSTNCAIGSNSRAFISDNTIFNSGVGVRVTSYDSCSISNNIIQSCNIGIESTYGHKISGNHILYAKFAGINIQSGNGAIISENHLSYSGKEAIVVESGDVFIVRNHITSSSQESHLSYAGLLLKGDVTCAVVSQNYMKKGGNANKPSYGIIVEANAKGVIISGDLTDSGEHGAINDHGVGTIIDSPYTLFEKEKLDGIEVHANNYIHPTGKYVAGGHITISAAAPVAPNIYDIWIDTNE